MIEPHIHCAECYAPVITKIHCAGGKTKDADVSWVQRPMVVPGPNGKLVILPTNVPLCDACAERITKAVMRQAQERASKLIVPRLDVAPKGRQQ